MSKNKVSDKVFLNGNKKDKKHYWLTPQALKDEVTRITGIPFEEFFDPCPYPKPEGFNGLKTKWAKKNFVNPPFGVVDDETGKKIGFTAWWNKCYEEYLLGNLVVIVLPVHNWMIKAMIACGASVCHMGDVKWSAIEDGLPGKGCGSIAMFVLDGRKKV